MAFAPMGPEASFFEVVDRHRASLLAALRGAGGGGGGRAGAPRGPASSSEVLASIENTIQDIVKSLARNEAPAFTIDSRSSWENIKFKEFYKVHHHRIRLYKLERAMKEGERKTLLATTVTTKMKFQKRFEDSVGLQMVCNCAMRKIRSDSTKSVKKFALILKILSMIYKLVQSNTYATKRDIYYTDSQLFGNQTTVDNIIDDISCMLKLPRRSLHILSTSKGLIAGNLRYMEEDGTKVNCTCGATAVAVPSNIQGIQNLITDAKFLLIVEKDATFQRLLDDSFCHKMSPCIMVTGKGVPDLNTRLLVRKLWDTFQIPIFTLVDADPHGIEIMCIYKYGSMSMSFEAHNLTVPAVRWLGLLPSDVKRLNISKDTLIPLTKQDQMKLDSILKRPYVNCQPFWRQEMELMAESKMKAEIQALTSLSSDYLSRVYLPNKLKFGGWI